MSKKRSFQGREAFHRMNFLYQACQLLQSTGSVANVAVSAHYGNIMTSVAKKCVLRMDCSVKRTLCKGCNLVLVPGTSVKVRAKRKQSVMVCAMCGTRKRFNLKKNYKIWHEREESIVEQFQCKKEENDVAVALPPPLHVEQLLCNDKVSEVAENSLPPLTISELL